MKVFGPKTGRTSVLIHGSGLNLNSWGCIFKPIWKINRNYRNGLQKISLIFSKVNLKNIILNLPGTFSFLCAELSGSGGFFFNSFHPNVRPRIFIFIPCEPKSSKFTLFRSWLNKGDSCLLNDLFLAVTKHFFIPIGKFKRVNNSWYPDNLHLKNDNLWLLDIWKKNIWLSVLIESNNRYIKVIYHLSWALIPVPPWFYRLVPYHHPLQSKMDLYYKYLNYFCQREAMLWSPPLMTTDDNLLLEITDRKSSKYSQSSTKYFVACFSQISISEIWKQNFMKHKHVRLKFFYDNYLIPFKQIIETYLRQTLRNGLRNRSGS